MEQAVIIVTVVRHIVNNHRRRHAASAALKRNNDNKPTFLKELLFIEREALEASFRLVTGSSGITKVRGLGHSSPDWSVVGQQDRQCAYAAAFSQPTTGSVLNLKPPIRNLCRIRYRRQGSAQASHSCRCNRVQSTEASRTVHHRQL